MQLRLLLLRRRRAAPLPHTSVPALLRAPRKHSHGAQRLSRFTFRLISCLSDFFTGELSPDFDLKNIILTYTKGFSWKKWSKFARFRNSKKFPSGAQYVTLRK